MAGLGHLRQSLGFRGLRFRGLGFREHGLNTARTQYEEQLKNIQTIDISGHSSPILECSCMGLVVRV